MASRFALERIAKLRKCSVAEARQLGLEVQGLTTRSPSYKSIARAITELGPDATVEDVAEEAFRIHGVELARRPFRPRRPPRQRGGRRQLRPSPFPEHIIVDGVVQSFRGWQKREGITKDE